jgi:hypothetical protein
MGKRHTDRGRVCISVSVFYLAPFRQVGEVCVECPTTQGGVRNRTGACNQPRRIA